MSDPIKIVVTAETQAAAAALQAFLKQTGSGLEEVKKGSTEAGKGFEDLAGKVYYFRSAIDGIRFAAMDGGARAAFYAVDELTRGLVAARISLVALVPYIGAAAVAVGAGFIGWKAYMHGVDDTTKSLVGLVEALDKVPDLIDKINKLQKAGLISPGAATEYASYLGQNPKKKLYRNGDGTYSPIQRRSKTGRVLIPHKPGCQSKPPSDSWPKPTGNRQSGGGESKYVQDNFPIVLKSKRMRPTNTRRHYRKSTMSR